MKNLFTLMITLLLAFTLVGCANESKEVETVENKEETVEVTENKDETVMGEEVDETVTNDETETSTETDEVSEEVVVEITPETYDSFSFDERVAWIESKLAGVSGIARASAVQEFYENGTFDRANNSIHFQYFPGMPCDLVAAVSGSETDVLIYLGKDQRASVRAACGLGN